jgi:hypothetical protein
MKNLRLLICLSRLQEIKTRQKMHVSPSALPPRESEKVGVRRGGSEGDCQAPTSNRGRGEANEETDDGVFGPKLAKRPSIQPHRFKPARRKFSNRFTSKKQLKSAQKSAASLSVPKALTQDSGDMDTPHEQDNGCKFEVCGEMLSDAHDEEGKRYGIRQLACNKHAFS